MDLARIDADRQELVVARLQTNLMAWLTTVRRDGRPDASGRGGQPCAISGRAITVVRELGAVLG